MKIAFFDTHSFETKFFDEANKASAHEIDYLPVRLDERTARLASGADVVCAFVNDKLDRACLEKLASQKIKLIALRCAGFNNVDLEASNQLGLKVVRVPEYSPYAVAELAVGLLLALNRKIHRAYLRNRDLNFTLEGLVGFDLHGKTVGVVGTGKIGAIFAKIMIGFGCDILAYDLDPSAELKAHPRVKYVELDELLEKSDVISLHAPLTPQTHHLINADSFMRMKKGAILLNTSRGGIVDSKALVAALKSEKLGAAGLDVYEEEEHCFFTNLSEKIVQDDILARLLTFPNVLITSHQGFLTTEALTNIAQTTVANIEAYSKNPDPKVEMDNEVLPDKHHCNHTAD